MKRSRLFRKINQPLFHQSVKGILWKPSIGTSLTSAQARQALDALMHILNRVNVEFSLTHGIDDRLAQHEILHITFGNQHPLFARQPPRVAEFKETLNLLIDSTNSLHLSELTQCTGDGKGLPYGHLGKG